MSLKFNAIRATILVTATLVGGIAGVTASKLIAPARDAGVTVNGLAMAVIIAVTFFIYIRLISKN